MIKMCTLIKRRDGLTREAFRDWWLNRHAPVARALPGLRRYQISYPIDEAEHDYDGMAELWFDSEAAMNRSFDSELGHQLLADSQAHAAVRVRIAMRENWVR